MESLRLKETYRRNKSEHLERLQELDVLIWITNESICRVSQILNKTEINMYYMGLVIGNVHGDINVYNAAPRLELVRNDFSRKFSSKFVRWKLLKLRS